MCRQNKRIICVASCLSMVQTIIWSGLAVAGALVYLGVITVQPYQSRPDFFRVTLAKLYFEGPNSKIDGSYLGKFGDDYRNPNVIDLFWPDKVFAVMVAYFIIHVIHFVVSSLLFLNRNPKKPHESRRLLDIALGWSCITLLLCAIDIMFTYFLFRDFFQIRDYLNASKCALRGLALSSDCENISDLSLVPLSMTLISARGLCLWAWNLFVACYFLLHALCYKKIKKGFHQPEKEREQEQKVADPSKPQQVLTPPIKLINESYSNSCDLGNNDSVRVKPPMEAITRFSDVFGEQSRDSTNSSFNPREGPSRYALPWHSESYLNDHYGINEGYESNEGGSIMAEETQNSNPNKIIKILKPPIGKPVSIPIPPPLPVRESCCC